MKKIFLVTLFVFATTSAYADKYTSTAKDVRFVAVDGTMMCNGIKVYDNTKFLFNLGYPECPPTLTVPGSPTDFDDSSYDHVVEVANELKDYVKTLKPETKIEFETYLWNEYKPTQFITIVK